MQLMATGQTKPGQHLAPLLYRQNIRLLGVAEKAVATAFDELEVLDRDVGKRPAS
jgi:hypothetical protein